MWITTPCSSLLLLLGLGWEKADAFVVSVPKTCLLTTTTTRVVRTSKFRTWRLRLPSNIYQSSPAGGERSSDDEAPDAEGASLASMFAKYASEKGIALTEEDLAEDEDDDFEDDDDDEIDLDEMRVPQETLNAIRGYETDDIDSEEAVKANLTLTDEKLYSEVKERVFDTAGGFVDYVKSSQVSDEEEDSEEDDEAEEEEAEKPTYKVPDQYPDASLTAGEVVELVLNALQNNNVGGKNKGMEIFFAYSSEVSAVKQERGLTPDEYVDYLQDTDYEILLKPQQGITIDRGDYSKDGARAFFTALIQTGPKYKDSVPVNFVLSNKDKMALDDEEDADYTPGWLIDSMMIRPQGMRRRGRR